MRTGAGRVKSLRRHVGRTVIVNTAGRERAFRGVLAAVDADAVTLDHAHLIEPRDVDLDGLVFLPADRVEWVQVV